MISFGTLTLPVVPLATGGLPLLNTPAPEPTPATLELLGEEAGRPLVRRPDHLLPYTSQSGYGRAAQASEVAVAVLENDQLRATFLLDFGGRLWSLIDKKTGVDLLFQPDAVQLGNLGLRGAWFAGGIEWNLGVTGHWGLTCEPVCAGVVGNVLRLWAFERLTGLVWRLEATLDDDRLLIGVRLHNPHDETVPLYWWSNTAVPMGRGNVLASASSVLWHGYERVLSRLPWPVMRPETAMRAGDWFIEVDEPWLAAVDDDGYGLLQTSTSQLHGRKLFVWGEGAGGHNWQRWLNGTRRYVEVQAGYARTQFEHVALPPGQTVSWTESYGPIRAGESPGVRPLPDPFTPAAATAPEVWRDTDGWGWLEVLAGHLPADPATPLTQGTAPDVAAWAGFVRGGSVPTISSTVVGPGWLAKLSCAPGSASRDLHLGHALWAAGRRSEAVTSWQRSVDSNPTADALRCLSVASVDGWSRFDYAERAWQADPGNRELTIEYLAAAAHLPALVLRIIEGLDEPLRSHPRVRLAECRALLEAGQVERAGELIASPIVLPDLREGSDELTDLWAAWQKASGSSEPLPAHYDFRMF